MIELTKTQSELIAHYARDIAVHQQMMQVLQSSIRSLIVAILESNDIQDHTGWTLDQSGTRLTKPEPQTDDEK